MKVDAIVNAANRSLLGGGGVDGAIHHAAGPELLEECRKLQGCETGQAKITGGYRLPARYVIHTVGPVWHGGGNHEEQLLRSCYASSLALAHAYACESVAFPMISAGTYGYPKDQAMRVAAEEISRFLENHEMNIFLVVFGHESFLTGTKLFSEVQEYIDDNYAKKREHKSIEHLRKWLWHRDEKAALEYDQSLIGGINADAAAKPREEIAEKAASPFDEFKMPLAAPAMDAAMPSADWDELLRRTDESFSDALFRLIDERGITDVQCYRKANVDRKLFSKIRSNPAYRPSKPTVCAFALALELPLPEARKLIEKAGFSLTRSSRFDIIVEFFLKKQFYDILQINEVLFEYDLPLLGSGTGAV